jgi:hypothetical protein
VRQQPVDQGAVHEVGAVPLVPEAQVRKQSAHM